MTSVLACVVATIALAADPGLKGLPFGVPPSPDDAVIVHVAPPQCLFYVNWAGTASPNPRSSSETEKLLAEPEVQELFNSISKVFVAYLRKTDEDAKKPVMTAVATPPTAADPSPPPPPPDWGPVAPPPDTPPGDQTLPSPAYMTDDVQYSPPDAECPLGTEAAAKTAAGSLPSEPYEAAPVAPPDTADNAPEHPPRIEIPLPAIDPQVVGPVAETPKSIISAEDYGDFFTSLLTHPTAIFVEDVKVTPAKAEEKEANPDRNALERPVHVKVTPAKAEEKKADKKTPDDKKPEEATPPVSAGPDVESRGGMVVSLGT